MTLLAILFAFCGLMLLLSGAQASDEARRRFGLDWPPLAMRLIGAGLVLFALVLLFSLR